MINLVARLGLARPGSHTSWRTVGAFKAFVLLGLTGLLTACGGGGGGGAAPGSAGVSPAVTLSSITVGPSSATVVAGLTLQFTATGVYSDGSQKDISSSVTWASSPASVATVSASGLASGVAAGTSSVSATLGGVTGQHALTVAPATLKSIGLSPDKPTVAAARTLQFTATGTYTDGSTQDLTSKVTWTSSDGNTAKFSTDPRSVGLATAVALGTTDIGASIPGGIAATAVRMTVTATVYAYATNFDADSVSQYVVSPSDGSLTPLSSPTVPAGKQPFSISVEPTGEYVYVSNWASSTVSQYRIGPDGGLSPIGSGTVPSGSGPNAVTIDHANRFAYVANLIESTICQYRIGLDGSLIPMSTPKVAAGKNPAALVVDPTDRFAYAADFGSNTPAPLPGASIISQYSIAADGSLSPMPTASIGAGSGPSALVIDPAGKHLYVTNSGDDNVGQYTLNSDGSLAPMAVPTVPSGGANARPSGIAMDPKGKYVYVANQTAGTISQYGIDATTGNLVAMATATVPAGSGVSAVTTDPTGKYLYAANRGTATISQFIIGVDGSLTPMASATAPSGTHPTAIATGY